MSEAKRAKGSGYKMKKEQQNKDENKNEEKDEMKKGFFKKVWYSIDKIEKYSELSAEGFRNAIKYLGILMVIISITLVFAGMFLYHSYTKQLMAAKIEKQITKFENQVKKDGFDKVVEIANSGDVVLLSPASASWDQYKECEVRGREFKDKVKDLNK